VCVYIYIHIYIYMYIYIYVYMCFGNFTFAILYFESKLTGYSLDMLHSHSYGKPHVLKD